MSKRSVGYRARVAVDLHSLDSIYQGSRTYCFEIFSRLIRLLPEIDFVLLADTTQWDPANEQVFAAPHVEIVSMPHTNSIRRLVLQMPALVKQHRIDLLHTQYICPVFLSARTAVTVHDVLFEDYPQYFGTFMRLRSKALYRLSAVRSDLLFSVSDYSRQAIAAHYGIPLQKIVKTPNGVDTQHFFPGPEFPGPAGHAEVEALGLHAGEYLLTVGRLEPRKNHIGLLHAYALLPQPRPRLVIVGQEDFGFENIYRTVETLGLRDDTLFLQSADAALLTALYRHARLFVYPSFAEGFGIPVLEAMASGVPVVTSNTTSLPEVAGGAAVLVDPASPQAICEAMQSVVDDPALAARMVEDGLAQAARYSWDASARAMEAAYRAYFGLEPRA
jgi:glycosyltransferase involved in cell wall biosynthesis